MEQPILMEPRRSRRSNDSGIDASMNESNEPSNIFEDKMDSSEDDSDDPDYQLNPWLVPRPADWETYRTRQVNLPFLTSLKKGFIKYVSPETIRKSLILLLRTNIAARQIPEVYKVRRTNFDQTSLIISD